MVAAGWNSGGRLGWVGSQEAAAAARASLGAVWLGVPATV